MRVKEKGKVKVKGREKQEMGSEGKEGRKKRKGMR